VIALIKFVIQLLWDAFRFVVLACRPSRLLVAENLFLRRQLALYKERGVKPQRMDAATRVSLAILSRLWVANY
jgi:putative transposase